MSPCPRPTCPQNAPHSQRPTACERLWSCSLGSVQGSPRKNVLLLKWSLKCTERQGAHGFAPGNAAARRTRPGKRQLHMHREPPGLKCGARWRTHHVDIVAVEFNAIAREAIQEWRLHLRGRAGAVEANITPALISIIYRENKNKIPKIINKNCKYMRRPRSRCENAGKRCKQE